jgi:uncharacterized protein YbaP (TraB family)
MLRRDFAVGMMSALFARHAVAACEPSSGTPLHVFRRERACIYLLGFGEAKDESWATPQVRRAFQQSSDLWLEVSHDPGSEPDAASKRELLTHDPDGRSFFDVLEPQVRVRAMEYCAQLGIALEDIAKQRPWSAFYAINRAYWSRHKESFEQQSPEEVLKRWAKAQGKSIRYEMPSQLEFARFMAALPDAAQSQYIAFLLDFLDDQTAGRNRGEFGWIEGDTSAGERAVERMRTRTPDVSDHASAAKCVVGTNHRSTTEERRHAFHRHRSDAHAGSRRNSQAVSTDGVAAPRGQFMLSSAASGK